MSIFKNLFGSKFEKTEKKIGSWFYVHEKSSDDQEIKFATSIIVQDGKPAVGFQFCRTIPSKDVEFDILLFGDGSGEVIGSRNTDILNGFYIQTVVVGASENVTRFRAVKTDELAQALEHAWAISEIQLGLDNGTTNEKGERLYAGFNLKSPHIQEVIEEVSK